MIKNLTEKLKLKKGELVTYDFEDKCTGVAGFCPDCDGIVSYVSYFQRYMCMNPECCFEANIKKERVWDNVKREENLQKRKNEKII